MNVYQKLNAAREEFHSLKLEKTGENKFAGYKYFELGDFLIPALKVFAKHGLCGTISFNKDFAKLCVVNTEKIDEYIPFESPMGSAALKGCHEVQNIGAVETYQRRYLWVAALEIVEHDALDATTGRDKPQQKAEIIPKSFRSSATMGVFETLAPDRQNIVADAAAYVIERFEANDVVAAYDEANRFHDDERVALAGKLPSHVRSGLKKHGVEIYSNQLKKELVTS